MRYAECPSCRGLTFHSGSCRLRHLSIVAADSQRPTVRPLLVRWRERRTARRQRRLLSSLGRCEAYINVRPEREDHHE